MNHNVDQQWFKDRWKEKGLSLRKVAKIVGMDPAALSYTLSGKRRMKISEAGKIATIIGATRDEVINHWEGVAEHSAASARRSRDTSHARRSSLEANEGERRPLYPGFGFMKGLIKIEPGFDVTGPFSDESWETGYLGEDRLAGNTMQKEQK